MSFDLYPNEIANGDLNAARNPALPEEPGFWHNAIPGAGKLTMQGLAQFAKGVDLLGSVGPIAMDVLTGTTERQDRYFAEHEQVFGSAVDYWTPGPQEVGTAAKVVGGVVPMLVTFGLSPTMTLASQFGTQAEDLIKEGVPLGKAEAASGVQTALLMAGMHLSNFGSNWATKALLSGAGVNIAQGVASRAAMRSILEGTGQEKKYNPWDAEAVVIDAILGVGFGTIQHLGDSRKRADMPQDMIDAALVANQARHLEDTTSPGVPMDPASQGFHVTAMKRAIDDMLNGRPVQAEQLLTGETLRGMTGPDGTPVTVYHGTDQAFNEFRGGMFTSNRARAENYAMGSNGRVIEAELDIRNPMPWADAFGKTPEEIKAAGFDGTVQWGDNGQVIRAIVTDPSQVLPVGGRKAKARFEDTKPVLSADDVAQLHKDLGIDRPIVPVTRPSADDLRAQRAEQQRALDDWAAKRSAVEQEQARRLTETEAGQRLSAIDGLKACLATGSMSTCLRKFAVDTEDRAAILDEAAKLREQGLKSEDASLKAAEAQRSAVEKMGGAEDLLAKFDAENPKPPEPVAMPEGEHPLVTEARQRLNERPDLALREVDEDGNVTTRSASDMLREADDAVAAAQADRSLFEVAAACLLGGS